jgi:hypothetical protein
MMGSSLSLSLSQRRRWFDAKIALLSGDVGSIRIQNESGRSETLCPMIFGACWEVRVWLS